MKPKNSSSRPSRLIASIPPRPNHPSPPSADPDDRIIAPRRISHSGTQKKVKMQNLSRKVAIITGASSGIGRACAIKLSAEGWAVVLSARREPELENTAALCDGETLTIVGDVTKEEEVLRLFEHTMRKFGRLDMLFNNAGLSGVAEALSEITLSNFMSVMSVNITAAVLCSREAFKIFKNQEPKGGRIINNGSLSAHTPRPEAAAYSISKHAMTGLTKSIALDGRPYNITATQIDIGNAATDMASHSQKGTLQADGSIRAEPLMDVLHVANSVAYITGLPNDIALLEIVIMAAGMPFVGRG